MGVPAMNYVGLAFDWFFALLSIVGYLYLLSKTGHKFVFLLIFAAAWVVFGVSYVLIISGVSSGEWYIALIRTIGYVLVSVTLLSLIVELAKMGQREVPPGSDETK